MVKLDATQKAFDGRLVGDFGVYGYSSKIHDIFDTRMLFTRQLHRILHIQQELMLMATG